MKAGVKLAAAVGVGVVLASHSHGGATRVYELLSAPKSAAQNVRLGKRLAARRYHWTGQQWICLDVLWDGESGWSQYADTRVTGLDPANAAVFAYGIPQARPATKMPRAAWPASLGGSSDPRSQIVWGLAYIHAVYRTPCNALAFKRAHGNQGY